MATEEPTEKAASGGEDQEGPAEGVFGNLPQTRPGTRSPRRTQPGKAKPASAEAPEPDSRAREPVGGADAPPEPPPAPQDEPAAAPGQQGGGIEDVAWAGVAAAAEAATIGVRLANRALEAMRDAVERR